MEGTKAFYMSKGFWGAIIVVAAAILNQLHIAFDASAATDTVYNAVVGVGGVVALIGRLVASKKIG